MITSRGRALDKRSSKFVKGKKSLSVTTFSVLELLRLYANILDELNRKNVTRSQNNPVADYAEWVVVKALGLSQPSSSNKGYDAYNPESNTKYQIKARRLHPSNMSRQLSTIHNLDDGLFDFLIGILFDRDFSLLEAYKIPHRLITRYARFSKHQNGHILTLEGDILKAKGVESIGAKLARSLPRS